jgi:putative C-S lyase
MYDFTSIVDRAGKGAAKWEDMKKKYPDLPPGIIPLSVADMEFRAVPEITRGLTEYLEDLVLGYTVPTPAYYEAVCGWMKNRHDWDIDRDWIVTSNGVVSGLFDAVRAFTNPGDGVIILAPVYYPFYRAIEINGRRVVASGLMTKDGRYAVDYDDLETRAKEKKNTLLIFCSPHNPVGRVWDREELERIGSICLENKVTVVSDEIHFDIVLPGYTHTVFASLNEDFAQNTVTCTAPSKTFNLAGLQASNIIIKNENLRKAFQETQTLHSGVSMLNIFGYKACEIAYTKCEKWLDELLGVLDQNRKITEEFIQKKTRGIRVSRLEGTYLQWWDCRALGMDCGELEQFMTNEALLFSDEGYVFGGQGKGFERINLACPSAVLEAALERLKGALERRARM